MRCFNSAALLNARLDLGLTQEHLAASLGVDLRTYRRYESGEINASGGPFSVRHVSRRRFLRRVARELGIAEEDLVTNQSASNSARAT
jgi:transcriptional regulator with XRE-family HTH domain